MGFGQYNLNKYELEVRDARSLDGHSADGVISTGCHVIIYDAGTLTKSTIYSDASKTAKTNDITRTQFATDGGKIIFWSAASSHDIFIADDKGNNVKHVSVTPVTHVLPIDRSGIAKCMFFPLAFNAGGTETDTGLDLPYGAWVHDVALEVVTVDATETVTIGLLSSETAGDADGLLLSTSVASAGFFPSYAVTDGTNEDYISASRKGALLGLGSTGTDAANDFGQSGGPGHFVTGSNAVSISYTPSSSDTFAGYGYVYYRIMR